MRNLIKTTFIVSAFIFLHSIVAFAENEAVYIFDNYTLNVPKAVVGAGSFELNLQLQPGSEPLAFTLTSFSEVNIDNSEENLVGTWVAVSNNNDPNVNQFVSITFLDSTNFILSENGLDGDEPNCNGIEHGTYNWDSSNNLFTYDIIVDTNGKCGFSDSNIISFVKSGDTLNISFDDAPNTVWWKL